MANGSASSNGGGKPPAGPPKTPTRSVVRNERGQIVKGSGPLNLGPRPKKGRNARLEIACQRAARKLGRSFEQHLADRAILGGDDKLLTLIATKLFANPTQKLEHEHTVNPTEDELERIREARRAAYNARFGAGSN